VRGISIPGTGPSLPPGVVSLYPRPQSDADTSSTEASTDGVYDESSAERVAAEAKDGPCPRTSARAALGGDLEAAGVAIVRAAQRPVFRGSDHLVAYQ
jgi:hypothetical protein